MANEIKFKFYDKKKNTIENYIDYSIAVDGGVQSSRDGVIKGTLNNRHITPIQYAGKRDIKGTLIYDGFIIKRIAVELGEEDITGVVEFSDCSWWITDNKQMKSQPLFTEIAMDEVIGNVYQDKELAKELGF